MSGVDAPSSCCNWQKDIVGFCSPRHVEEAAYGAGSIDGDLGAAPP